MGIPLYELELSYINASTKTKARNNIESSRCRTPSSYHRRHDIDKWLQRKSGFKGHENKTDLSSSTLMGLAKKSVGGNNVGSQKNHFVGNYEIVVLSKVVTGDSCILVALNLKGTAVLQWKVSKSSAGEWFVRKAKLNHEDFRMAVLVPVAICGDYAFVIHTRNPLSGDTSEIYADVIAYASKKANRNII